jgi:hypothetical protein
MDSANTPLNRNLDSVGSWIDAYFESLVKISAETGQRESLALKRSNFPKAVYRYRRLEGLTRILEELRDGYVFLSNPAEFNDPYDSALSVSWEHLQMQVVKKFAPAYGYDPNTECKFFASLGEKEKEEWRVQQEFEQFPGSLPDRHQVCSSAGGGGGTELARNRLRLFTNSCRSDSRTDKVGVGNTGKCLDGKMSRTGSKSSINCYPAPVPLRRSVGLHRTLAISGTLKDVSVTTLSV